MAELLPTIGLEIHAELKTLTKMFCRSRNDPDETRPNVNVCPICLAHPGTLPTINKEAVRHVLRVGAALSGTLADYTEFDRKNYFYPDIPKGYQISQYQFPLVSGGSLKGVDLTRIHLEEDTATNRHEGDHSLVDYNRAGVPLMELVTEPVITSAKQAGDFARELQLLLRYLGVSEANMEKGEMRVEANISVAPAGERGTKVEVKNLNSFRAVEKAIEYELARQAKAINSGEKVVQETRGWDDAKQSTFSQRKKESSHDYRYFPDPDLPKLKISEIAEFQNLDKTMPELPWASRNRYLGYGLKEEDANMFVSNQVFGKLFEETLKIQPGTPKIIANFIANDIAGWLSKNPNLDLPQPEKLARIVGLFNDKKFNSRQAKDAIEHLINTGAEMEEVSVDENTIVKIVREIITSNPKVVEDYKAGKATSLQFLIGQGMKKTAGAANPEVLKKLFAEHLA